MTAGLIQLEAMAALARDLLGPGVHVGCGHPGDGSVADLMAAERVAMRGMTGARQREFATGRRAVRQAAKAAGRRPFALPMGADRAPVWPEGVIGSIAHSDRACLAVVADRARLVSVGVDLEPDTPLPDAVAHEVCTAADRRANPALRAELGEGFALMVFAAKEAVYKCQYPLTGSLIGFDAVSIRFAPQSGSFEARFDCPVGLFSAGDIVAGRYARTAGHVLTTASVSAAQWAQVTDAAAQVSHA